MNRKIKAKKQLFSYNEKLQMFMKNAKIVEP